MSTKMSILGLGFAVAILAGCGNSSPPPPKAKRAAASVASFEAKAVTPEERKPNTAEEKPFEGYVGVAPPGHVAFGPAALGSNPQSEAELQKMRDTLARSRTSTDLKQPPTNKNGDNRQ